MNKIIAAAVLALAFTTGFTCSKNTPPEPTPETVPAQEEMAAPAGTDASAAGEPAAPATEPATK